MIFPGSFFFAIHIILMVRFMVRTLAELEPDRFLLEPMVQFTVRRLMRTEPIVRFAVLRI